VNLEPPSPAAIVHIKLPVTNGGRRLITSKSNGNGGDNLAAEERAFRVENLATASSIFHRKHHASPRSFLWRVLERGHVLSIRAVDVCKEEKAPDANLVVHVHFPKPLRPGCVAFADPENHDALCVFALDESLTLNYLILRPDVFRKRSATDQGLGDAFRPHVSSSFGFKAPHRLVAVSSDEFVVTLIDGGIIAFRREKSHECRSPRPFLVASANAPDSLELDRSTSQPRQLRPGPAKLPTVPEQCDDQASGRSHGAYDGGIRNRVVAGK